MLSVTSYLTVADKMKGDKLKCVALCCRNNSKWCQFLAPPTGFTDDCHLCVTWTNSRPEVIYSAPTSLEREYSAVFFCQLRISFQQSRGDGRKTNQDAGAELDLVSV